MIRAAIELTVGACVILALAWVFLFLTPLAHAGECGGRMVNASIYGHETCQFNPDPRCPTAGGVLYFDGSQLLVAHRTLPLGSKVRLTFRGKSITVKVLDRGPAKWTHREVDLSKATAHAIGFDKVGSGRLCMEVLK